MKHTCPYHPCPDCAPRHSSHRTHEIHTVKTKSLRTAVEVLAKPLVLDFGPKEKYTGEWIPFEISEAPVDVPDDEDAPKHIELWLNDIKGVVLLYAEMDYNRDRFLYRELTLHRWATDYKYNFWRYVIPPKEMT